MTVFYNLPNQIVGEKVEVDDPVVDKKRDQIIAARLGDEPHSLTDVLTEAYLESIREMTEVRREHPGHNYRYAIDIKVHSLDLTPGQKSFIYENWDETMNLFWSVYIRPWMRQENGLDIHRSGRSGGWLVLDRPVVGDPKEDRYAKRWPEFHEARSAYRDVKKFREGWKTIFKDIKKRLEKIMRERGVDDL